MEQVQLPALGQIQRRKPPAKSGKLHVAVGDPVPHLLRQPGTAVQDIVGVVALHCQNIYARKPIAQINGVCGKGQLVPVYTAAYQVSHWFLRVVEYRERLYIIGADDKRQIGLVRAVHGQAGQNTAVQRLDGPCAGADPNSIL